MKNKTHQMEELKRILTDTGDNSLGSWLILCLLWFIVLLVAGLIMYILLLIVNYSFRPTEEGTGRIIEKRFEEAHYSTVLVYNAATKTSEPVTTWHPNSWKITFEIDDCVDDMTVSSDTYLKNNIGSQVSVRYTTGRLWHSVSIKSAQLR